ncbi:hypothetical protein GD1_206 [Paraglaciecola Antarctic GD virus 1]|nr:hypothetical protein GD1_206 [Paraglaciecola Antarctic GD virus 1]
MSKKKPEIKHIVFVMKWTSDLGFANQHKPMIYDVVVDHIYPPINFDDIQYHYSSDGIFEEAYLGGCTLDRDLMPQLIEQFNNTVRSHIKSRIFKLNQLL